LLTTPPPVVETIQFHETVARARRSLHAIRTANFQQGIVVIGASVPRRDHAHLQQLLTT